MASNYVLERTRQIERVREIAFAGDGVRLAGQINYPSSPPPLDSSYPLIFIVHHAGWNTRDDYAHYARLGVNSGYAVFRWDKRGTGRSGAGGCGSSTQDAVYAYETALEQPNISRKHVIILAQGDGTRLLGDAFGLFARIQRPAGVILASNMLDPQAVCAIDAPVHIVQSEGDWNDWQQYSREAAICHNTLVGNGATYYVARGACRNLLNPDKSFHTGVKLSIQDWLESR